MRLSTLTQRSELRAAEDRHELAGPIAVVALLAALILAFGGHWVAVLAAAAVGGFVLASTALEVRAVGDPCSSEEFYRLADPRQPLELPAGAVSHAAGTPGSGGVEAIGGRDEVLTHG